MLAGEIGAPHRIGVHRHILPAESDGWHVDWVALATGMGVPTAPAHDADTLVRELWRAPAEPGSHLVEARID